MTWLYVPNNSERSPSAADYSASKMLSTSHSQESPGLWALSNGKPTLQPLSWRGWKARAWVRFLSGTISQPSTAERGAAQWIASLLDSPVSLPRSPESAAAPTTSGGCGPTSTGSSSIPTLRCCSSRTCQGCSRSTQAARSARSSATWPRAGGLRSGTAFPREASAPRTSEIVSICWLPTPTASIYGSSQNGINGKGGTHERPSAGTSSLMTMARTGELAKKIDRVTSPPLLSVERTVIDRRLLIPTATATDAKASGVTGNWSKEKAAATSGRHSGTTLTDYAVRAGSDGRRSSGGMRLNPRFVSWMMGSRDGDEHVVDDASIEWADQIHALGNGVARHAAATAVGILLGRIER